MNRKFISNGKLRKVCLGFVILHPDSKIEEKWSICPKIFTMLFFGSTPLAEFTAKEK